MQLDFTDKRVLVTGGTRGIGRAIVEAFLEAGARVAVNGSTEETTGKAVEELGAGDRVVGAPGSVGRVTMCESIVAAAVEGLGGLDVLVNNAGIGGGGPVEETKEEIFDQVMDINLKGVYFMTKHAAPHLRKSGGNIINVASVMGIIGAPYGSIYGASKAAVMSLTRSHALEFGSAIRVNSVVPGGVDTDMLRSLAMSIADDVESGYEILSKDTAAQHRIADAREIAGPVLYLASDLASFVTGSTHVVDGGEVLD
jgi:NAD(P)-dependent dehydrogenase (short-subunit alcohol dehydrogenase family)